MLTHGDVIILIALAACAAAAAAPCPRRPAAKLLCYYGKSDDVDACRCSHVVLPPDVGVAPLERIRERARDAKILITATEFNQGLVSLLKSGKVDGLEINLKKLDSRSDISDFIATVRSKLGSDLTMALSVPAKSEILAKYYDFKGLSKNVDLFILQTAFLGANHNVTFHPSRLSGLWDMQNIDSVVDLVGGLGAPLSKLVVASPVQGLRFQLQSNKHTAPGAPALAVESLMRDELCGIMKSGNWTLERDQDQAGPYIFSNKQWIAFDDEISIDMKAKYTRIRGLAGMALKDLSQDGGSKCEKTLLEAAFAGLSKQSRAPRGAVLHSLEREILDTAHTSLDTIQLSPYRITRIIDVEGNVNVVRQDTRTEFRCTRQGYFVHPRSCNRFYRCVKFNQLSDEFNVFEFDCPAGLAFDETVEVCVWPGSLPHGAACAGSSEIAPVPRQRFVCPSEPGYYADPENCRWFFACLDHGTSEMSAYEFRCPFGLVYDESRLMCEWPWLVPKCGNSYILTPDYVYGGGATTSLEEYDGLGVLGRVSLGGLSGPLHQPILYSNIGSGGGYFNQHHSLGGLSLQTTPILQNSALLESNNIQNQHNSQYSQNNGLKSGFNFASLYKAQNSAEQENFPKVAQNLVNGGANVDYGTGAKSGQTFTHYHDSGFDELGSNIYQTSGDNLNYNSGQKTQYQGSGIRVGSYNENSGNLGTVLIGSNDYQRGGAQLDTGLRYNSRTKIDGALQVDSGATFEDNVGILQNVGFGARTNIGVLDSGAKSEQSFTQYHGNTASISTGTAGNINIIGGGYSAVGVDVTNNGQDSNVITNVSPSPISVTTLAVPTVTSVPLPAVKTVETFENYKGGVVANIPELQYKIQGTSTPRIFTVKDATLENQASIVSGISYQRQNLDGFVSSTAVPIVEQDLIQPLLVNQPEIVSPGVLFKENRIKIPTLQQSAFVSSYNYRRPIGIQKTVIAQPTASYTYQNVAAKPLEIFDETPASVVRLEQKPSIVSSYSFAGSTARPETDSFTGYTYPRTSSVALIDESVEIGQPQINYTAYDHPKPLVAFVEQPVRVPQPIVRYSTPSTIAVEQSPAAVVSSYSFTGSSTPKPEIVEFKGYSTPRPAVSFVEEPVKVVQPAVVINKQPAAIVDSYTIPSFGAKADFNGYNYPKPSVVQFVEQPSPVVTYENRQPVVEVPFVAKKAYVTGQANSYQYNQHFNNNEKVVIQEQPIVSNPIAAVDATFSYSLPSTVRPAVLVQEPTLVVKQPATVQSSYSVIGSEAKSASLDKTVGFNGYSYSKPSVEFVEGPSTPVITYENREPFVRKNGYTTGHVNSYQYNQQFNSNKKVVVQEQPIIPNPIATVGASFSYSAPSTVKPAVIVQQPSLVVKQPATVESSYSVIGSGATAVSLDKTVAFNGYNYPKPSVEFVEGPSPVITYENREPIEEIPYVRKNAYTSAQGNSFQYNQQFNSNEKVLAQEQPIISNPIATVGASFSYSAPSTVTPAVIVQKPSLVVKQPATVESSYSLIGSGAKSVSLDKTVGFNGYSYPKPSVQFVEQPSPVITYENREPIEEVPFVRQNAYTTGHGNSYQYNQQFNSNEAVATVGGSFSYSAPSTVKPFVVVKQPTAVLSTISSTPTPQIDGFTGYKYPKPSVPFVEKPITIQQPAITSSFSYIAPSTIKPAILVDQPAPVVSSYSFTGPSTPKPQIAQAGGYDYPKPTVSFIEEPINIEQPSVVLKRPPAVISSYSLTGISTPKPQTQFAGYEYSKPAVSLIEEPIKISAQPAVVSNTNYYVPSTVKPAVVIQKQSPTVLSDRYNFGTTNIQLENIGFQGYDYPKPGVEFEETPVVKEPPVTKGYISGKPLVVENYEAPTYSQSIDSSNSYFISGGGKSTIPRYEERIVLSTPKPTFISTIRDVISSKFKATEKPFYFFDSRLTSTPKTVVKTYSPPVGLYSTSLPSVDTVSTSRPIAKYAFGTSIAPEISYVVTTPKSEYLPVRVTTEKAIVAPDLEYLPVVQSTTDILKSTFLPVTEEYQVLTKPAVKVVKIVRPKTIVKVNDFHPLLPAKLGAQCTCLSNAVRLRKRPKTVRIQVEEEDNDDDGYVVAGENHQGTFVENYEYLPPKTVDIAPVVPTALSTPIYRKQFVRTEVPEVFIKKTIKQIDDAEEPGDKEIVRAVKTGLKLVKQAAKEGAREGTAEVLAGKFDRYGPGGLRDRNEVLQGTVDCQRAGLFRHPTQCNKFYACRWDCTKNRYTLHIFNCPVHLTFDNSLGACNWPSQGPACADNTLLPSD